MNELRAPRPCARSIRRRGVAMMLVLISLAVATIITSAYVASRDNSALIGQNVVSSAGAREAAISGIELGVAILQTESDWRMSHVDGRLLEAYPLDGGGELDLDLIDTETDMPPTEETRVVEMIATARVNGVAETATARAEIFGGGDDSNSIDVDLSEFGVFAGDKLRMEDQTTINRWSSSPLAGLGNAINVGTQATTAGTIELLGDAAAIDTQVFTPPGASGSLITNTNGPSMGVTTMLDVIPMPDPPSPDFSAPADWGSLPKMTVMGGVSTVSGSSADYQSMQIMSGGKLTVSGDMDINTNGIEIKWGGRLLIDGNVTIVSYNDVDVLDGGSIEVLPGASLTLFLDKRLTVSAAYIGDGPYNFMTDMDTSGNARWMEPDQITIYSMPTTSNMNWHIHNGSVVKGRLYAKNLHHVELRHTSAFYGNIVANDVLMREQSAIFYDHTLDAGNGYTAPNSRIYDDFDRIVAELLALASLNTFDVQSVADAMSVVVTNGSDSYEGTGASAAVEETERPPTEPTPRPLLVEYEITSVGGDSSAWEDASS